MPLIDRFLNGITMYRLVLYGLAVMAFAAFLFSALGMLGMGILGMAATLAVLFAACYATNALFSWALRVPANAESTAITALILFLLFSAPSSPREWGALVLAAIIAVASKYLIAPLGKHVFNPAAIGAVVVYALGLSGATWWVATPTMLPIVAVIGFLITRKTRRESTVLTFLGAALVSITIFNATSIRELPGLWKEVLLSWPVIFFATVMLTEPVTMPPRRALRLTYAILTGILTGIQFPMWHFAFTPELALIVANVFSFVSGYKRRLTLTLRDKHPIAKDVWEFVFDPSARVTFDAGQYMEFTLPHHSDIRGNRRYFTVASSPTETELRLGVKTYTPSSSYKQAMMAMRPGDTLLAGQVAGDFTLPDDPQVPLAFIAGGIGITPFRSMAKYLTDLGQRRDVIILYAARAEEEVAYRDVFLEAENVGIRTIYVLGQRIDEDLLRREVPDFTERTFYISGPDAMVSTYRALLKALRIKTSRIKTDYFPGLA